MKILLIILLLPLVTWAKPNKLSDQERINKALEVVTQWELSKSQRVQFKFPKSLDFNPSHDCDDDDDDKISCVDAACDRMSTFACDETKELREVARACRGNRNGLCLNAMCDRMSSFKCDEFSEIRLIAESCRRLRNGDCVNVICDRMSSFKCDEVSEVTRVGHACRGVHDPECINEVCSKMSSFECDEIDELEEVAAICRGDFN